jgi:hypothetical protein
LSEVIFKARRKVWQMALMTGSFIILAGGLAGINILGNLPGTAYLIVTVMIVFFLVILFFSLLNMMVQYRVSPDAILLKSPLRKESFPFRSLKEFRLLDPGEVQEFWKAAMTDELNLRVKARNTADVSGYKTTAAKYKDLTRYCTIMPSTLTGGFDDVTVTHHKVFISGKFVLLETDSGRKFLLTPVDAEGLIGSVTARLNLSFSYYL